MIIMMRLTTYMQVSTIEVSRGREVGYRLKALRLGL